MALYVEEVKVLETAETAEMEKQYDGHHLALAHYGRSLGSFAQNEIFGSLFEISAEFVNYTKNIGNFSEVNHSGIFV